MGTKTLPVVMIILQLSAALVCAVSGDGKDAGYWLCGAGIVFFKIF